MRFQRHLADDAKFFKKNSNKIQKKLGMSKSIKSFLYLSRGNEMNVVSEQRIDTLAVGAVNEDRVTVRKRALTTSSFVV